MRRGFWGFVLSSILVLGLVSSACACSCMNPGTVAEAMSRSTAVFFGTVITIVPLDGTYPIQMEEPVAVTLAVRESWKGPQTPTITLYTVINGMSCNGYFWEEAAAFLVYAHSAPDGRLAVSLCSRTSEEARAAEDLTVLGVGHIPQPNRIPEVPSAPLPVQSGSTFPWITLVVSVVSTIGLGMWFVIRYRRDQPPDSTDTH